MFHIFNIFVYYMRIDTNPALEPPTFLSGVFMG